MASSEPIDKELLLFRLNRLASTSGQPLIRYCEGRFGISRREWRLILMLSKGGPCGSSQLADRARIGAGPTSRTISQLADKGLVTRRPLSNDRRQVMIELTEKGQEIFSQLYPVVQSLNERLISALTVQEQSALSGLLDKLDRRVDSWMDDIVLPKADRRHRQEDS